MKSPEDLIEQSRKAKASFEALPKWMQEATTRYMEGIPHRRAAREEAARRAENGSRVS